MSARQRSADPPSIGGDATAGPPTAPHKRRRRPRGPRGTQLALRGVPKLTLVRDRPRAMAQEPPPPPPPASTKRRARGVMQMPFVLPDRSFPKGRVIERFELSASEKGRALALSRRHLPVVDRPKTRADCARGVGIRPCPWVACKHHLYLDVTNYTSVKVNFPGLEEVDPPAGAGDYDLDGRWATDWPRAADHASAVDLSRMPETCSLDVADKYPEGLFLDQVGEIMNLTMERIRQLELSALAKLRKVPGARERFLEYLQQRAEREE